MEIVGQQLATAMHSAVKQEIAATITIRVNVQPSLVLVSSKLAALTAQLVSKSMLMKLPVSTSTSAQSGLITAISARIV